MGCGSCGSTAKGEPSGCGDKGFCSSGGCNKLNVFDWLSDLPSSATRDSFDVVEVSFKSGSRKEFHRNNRNLFVSTGDFVIVDSSIGYDIGMVSLSGELVRLQMKKKKVPDNDRIARIQRVCSPEELEKARHYRSQEQDIMLKARVMAMDLRLEMKIGDVEYQADGKKITFYYTAERRIDFRELIKLFARDFRARIEMRQIGARQEAGKIGGIGSCGRELCCSSWLTSFKTVSTSAARYQHLSINQSKLSGQCGRLKCCLNYELDTYLDALKDFPKKADYLQTKKGSARLVKTDIFKRRMWYAMPDSPLVMLSVDRVKEVKQLNKDGIKPDTLEDFAYVEAPKVAEDTSGYENTVAEVDINSLQKIESKRRKKRRKKPGGKPGGSPQSKSRQGGGPAGKDGRRKPHNKGGKSNKPKTTEDGKRPPQKKTPKSKGPDGGQADPKKKSDGPRRNRDGRQENKPKSDKPKSNKPRNDKQKGDKPKSDKPRNDKPKSDKPKSDKPRNDKPKSDKTKSDMPRNDKPKRDKDNSDKKTDKKD